MNEQLKVTPRRGDAESRCPYCHDLLGGEDLGDVQVECEGCGTQHHLACLTELGRCTVMGCDRPLDDAALADRPPATSRLQRLIRQRQHERARQFVRRNAQGPRDGAVPARLAPREGGWGGKRGARAPLSQDPFARSLFLLGGLTILLTALALAVAVAMR